MSILKISRGRWDYSLSVSNYVQLRSLTEYLCTDQEVSYKLEKVISHVHLGDNIQIDNLSNIIVTTTGGAEGGYFFASCKSVTLCGGGGAGQGSDIRLLVINYSRMLVSQIRCRNLSGRGGGRSQRQQYKVEVQLSDCIQVFKVYS